MSHSLPLRRALLIASCWIALPCDARVRATSMVADTVIHGGTIYTGEDRAPFVGDVAITGDRIRYVGAHFTGRARQTIDARHLIVSPGLIDAHTHPDSYIRSADPVQRLNAPWTRQGVSTLVIGVDGFGTPDVAADLNKLQSSGIGTNVITFVGFEAIRKRVLGDAARAPTDSELGRERALVAKGMCEGAVGFSTGLFYAPQSFASTEEVISLAQEAGLRGGLYDTHQRDESDYTIGLLASVKEVLRIGKEAGLPVHFAHLKALGVDEQGKAPAIIALIDEARRQGQDVTADQYPWLASGSNLEAALVPRWAMDGGYDAMLKRLLDPALMRKIRPEMEENLRRRGGASSLLFTAVGNPWTGKRLSEMASAWNVDPVTAAIRILNAPEQANGRPSSQWTRANAGSVASFNMSQSDVDTIMAQPWVVTSSDGSDGHPRQYANFPEKFVEYVVKRHVIDVNTFIRRSTGASADIYQIRDRGYLRTGYFADVLLFDPARYAPRATYIRPREYSVGVVRLFINGVLAVKDDEVTGAAQGRALHHAPTPGSCVSR